LCTFGVQNFPVYTGQFTSKEGIMQQYRLLRNNQESGPYSEQDLIELGLKAYDLIWMEGRSSSWKYPSELDPLKAYAPPVTDDLYVLFHTPKKLLQSAVYTTTSTQVISNKRYVSVILPSTVQKKVTRITTAPQVLPAANLPSTDPPAPVFAYPAPAEEKSKHRFLIAGSFLLLLAGGIYLGTSSKIELAKTPDAAEQVTSALVSLTSAVDETPESSTKDGDPVPLPKNNLLEFAAVKRFVQVKSSSYDIGFFGGIVNLNLTVKNTGNHRLTDIVIAVDYLLSDKTIHHSENISIPALLPGDTRTVAAPQSKVGIAVRTRIIGVNKLSIQ
jgi:hypothetical protein